MKKYRSLVIVSKALAPYRVGFYSEVAKALSSNGWQVTLVVAMLGAKDHPWSKPGAASNEILRIIGLSDNVDPSFGKLINRILSPLGVKDVEIPKLALFAELQRLSPDVVWTHEYSPFCLAAAMWASLKDRHCILSTDLGANPPPHSCTPIQLSFQKTVSFLYEGVIANTPEATRRNHPKNVPIIFAPHAIDVDHYISACPKTQSTFRFLFVGGVRKEKGIRELVNACEILVARGHMLELRVVGTGPLSTWLGTLPKNWLSIAGFLEGEALANEYSLSDVYVLPTAGDTYGVTVHEAAASGLPLIVGRSAGAVETLVIEGITGFSINPKDVDQLADRMEILLTSPEKLKKMGIAARRYAESYDVKILGRKTADFIEGFAKISGTKPDNFLKPVTLQNLKPDNTRLEPFKITAVFVTMNRSATAITCLKRLRDQSLPPSQVIVVDNASTDDTARELVEFQKECPEFVQIISLSENLGNAGGIELGMDQAFVQGADSVWILDDDSWPTRDAISQLTTENLPLEMIRASRVIDPETGNLSWPMQVKTGSSWSLLEGNDLLPKQDSFRIRRSWLGALIPKEVYRTVGSVRGDLFLRGEDEDYPRRIERAGFQVTLFPKSILHHPSAGRLHRWSVFGQEIVLERMLSPDKLYYRLRNAWWIEKDNSGTLRAAFDAILYLVALVRWERSVRSWFPIWLEAFLDAMNDQLGKRRSR